jgi:lipopolysaccharide biosynthesis regulator YciM
MVLMDNPEYPSILETDPGNPEFADYADKLRRSSQFGEAMIVCLKGLSANPACQRGRLILARTYFDQKLIPFALKELEQLLIEIPDNQLLAKLISTIAPGHKLPSSPSTVGEPVSTEAETVAEAEFAFEELDLIEEDQRSKNK